MSLPSLSSVRTGSVVLLSAGLLAAGITAASAGGPTAPPSNGRIGIDPAAPVATKGDSIPNISLVSSAIKAYYGDTVVTTEFGTEHYPSATGNYAKEIKSIQGRAALYLLYRDQAAAGKPATKPAAQAAPDSDNGAAKFSGRPALVFDIDDTVLNTYNYEIATNFTYNPTTNGDYVNTARFPVVSKMQKFINAEAAQGYTVFFITGRPEAQRDGTVANLTKVGVTVPTDPTHLFLKNTATPPSYLTCGATCTTIQYKSGTRAYIESQGYDIVADFGDQYSDLAGGSTDTTFKLPNPMYYLP
ncbi:HAD family acid phosphatase [Jatrophihabitans sp. YIM 134969]